MWKEHPVAFTFCVVDIWTYWHQNPGQPDQQSDHQVYYDPGVKDATLWARLPERRHNNRSAPITVQHLPSMLWEGLTRVSHYRWSTYYRDWRDHSSSAGLMIKQAQKNTLKQKRCTLKHCCYYIWLLWVQNYFFDRNVINSQKEASATGLRVRKLFIAVAALARFNLFGESS